ncbi:glycosyltransferase family A protein [Solidesulfovibrio magneticus]|uniref:Glycosyltransferase n=1 Tax=Solidesulfovibrio magneticus (strain ATCC 700980 / DSM 13731 / RS-1) TaxID=573370 RepID=C4XGF5_SOLM1|nr:glycosyltransferase family A protein [Solidesulfovibrio magneticus]BAH73735.1 putative glycosyltransferase [Solidesulfovibrio magneticus RS-1]
MESIDASVIVPTCDRPEELREALSSLAGQTHGNFEVVVVNDGGGDVSGLVAEATASLGGRPVRLAPRGKCSGPAAARNRGLAVARGAVVFYLDDDDVFFPNHVAVHMAAHAAAPEASAVYSDARRGVVSRDASGRESVAWSVPHSREFDPDALLVANYIPVLCLSHRRERLTQAGRFEQALPCLEDWDFFIRLARLGPFVHLPEATAAYFERGLGTSVQERSGTEFIETLLRVYARADALYPHDKARLDRVWQGRLAHIAAMAEATARRCEAAGDWSGAAMAWENAARHAPTPERYLALARVRKRLGQGQKALVAMQLAAACRDLVGGK